MINTSRIRAAREGKGVSQENLADRLNISQSTYARMENGQQKIEAGQLFKMAEELQTSVGDFLDDNCQFVQNGDHNFAAFYNENYYSIPKDMYDQHMKLLGETIKEMRQERQEFMELLKLQIQKDI